MSVTVLAWLTGVVVLAVAALGRAPYGFALYLLTFYLFPSFWWWGDALPDLRWNLGAGIVFLVAVLLQTMRDPRVAPPDPATKRILTLAVVILINATLVHLFLAPSLEVSADSYVLLAKFVVLFFLIVASIRSPRDLRLVLWAIVLGAAYIGFEVTVNDRGRMIGGRLEGVGAAGVANANELASLMATVVPLAGALFFWGKWYEKLGIAICGPLILNVVLLCSSRGAILAIVAGAVTFFITSTGPMRKKALGGLLLAGLASVSLLGDPEILGRFSTVFDSADDRDHSASGRLLYWTAGLRMVRDHPLGAGGEGFKRAMAEKYLAGVGINARARSVHNGLLNEACEWGLQGFALRMMFLGFAVTMTRRVMRHQASLGGTGEAVAGSCLIAAVATFVVSSVFGDYLDNEWGYWVPALMVGYARVYGVPAVDGLKKGVVAVPPIGAAGRVLPQGQLTRTAGGTN